VIENRRQQQGRQDAEYKPSKIQDRGIMPRPDLLYYFSKHRTTGCKLTHMFGVPMIVAAIVLFPFQKKKAAAIFGLGWCLQFIGHFCFERNTPVFLEMRSIPTALSALIFVAHEWKRLLTGKKIVRS
jgi:uncharacterized membrane protein YGL010W